MAKYTKRSGSSYGYKGSYKRAKYSSTYSRAKGQFKAAAKGNDSLSFVVQCNHVFTANYQSQDQSGVAAINVWDVLNRNTNFNSLKKMYDQVKIDGIKVKLSITNAQIALTDINNVRNYTIYTAWDKTGLSPSQVRFYTQEGAEFAEIEQAEFDNDPVAAWKTKIGSSIVNNSTARKTILNSFQRWGSNLSCYPNLLIEKGQYVQTGDIKTFCNSPNGNTLISTTVDTYDNRRVIDLTTDGNPVIPFESTAVRFKPILLVGVFQNQVLVNGNVTQYGNIDGAVIFNGEWSIACTFRNLKGALTADGGQNNMDIDPDNLEENEIDVELNEQQMDEIMNQPPPYQQNNVQLNVQNNSRALTTRNSNSNSRALTRAVSNNPYVTISNFLDSQYITRNQRGLNYATRIRLHLPYRGDVTPLDVTPGTVIRYENTGEGNIQDWTSDDGTIVVDGNDVVVTKKFGISDWVNQQVDDVIQLMPGSSLLIKAKNKLMSLGNAIQNDISSIKNIKITSNDVKTAIKTAHTGWKIVHGIYKVCTDPAGSAVDAIMDSLPLVLEGVTELLPESPETQNHYLLTDEGLKPDYAYRTMRDDPVTDNVVLANWLTLGTGENGVFRNI